MSKLKSIRTIAIVYNLKKNKNAVSIKDDRDEEYDEIETIHSIKDVMEKNGFNVTLLEQDDAFLDKIRQDKPDFVLNISEGKGFTRSRESQIPCILESLDIPYSGSDALALGITLDKYLTNLILKSADIPVPSMLVVNEPGQISQLKDSFGKGRVFIVKPRWEGSSKGIFLDSVVSSYDMLREKVEYVLSKYHQPALVEEFLENDEITVGVCGNKDPYVLGMMRIVPRDGNNQFFVYSIENKRDWRNKIDYETPDNIPGYIQSMVVEYALAAFKILELRDIARIDFRVDNNNVPRIIDINPLPGLSPHYSDLPIMYKIVGKSYPDLICKILKTSFARYGFKFKQD